MWIQNKGAGMKRGTGNYYLLFWTIEVLLFIFFSIRIRNEEPVYMDFNAGELTGGAEYGETAQENGGAFLFRTEELCLTSGIYDISVSYSSSGQGRAEVIESEKSPGSLWADSAKLAEYGDFQSFQVWVNAPSRNLYVQASAETGELYIKEIQIKTADNSKRYRIICLLLKLALPGSVAAVWYFRKRLRKYCLEIVAIGGITLFASLGLLVRYMLPGHDLVFHLLRIEGLKDGLFSGVFPVRIQPNWCNGWGYAVSVMYGDTLLFLPAIMRMIGFTVQTSYKTFVIAVNLATALTAWLCFYRIGRDRHVALLGSFLYVMAPYRLCCIYVRGAFGEYTAMMFLPLVVLWLWYVFHGETEEKDYGGKLAVPVIGFSGLVQTHVLTCQMVGIFILLFCVFMAKKIFAKGAAAVCRMCLYVLKTGAVTVLVNLWFIVPFLRYFREDLICTEFREMALDYQMLGVSIAELLAQEPSGYYGYSWSELASLGNKFSIPLGNGLVLCAGAALLLLWKDRIKEKGAAAVLLLLGFISVWMASNLFPYRKMGIYLPGLASFLAKPGLPYRYLGIACILLSSLAVIVFASMKREGNRTAAAVLAAVIVLAAADQGAGYIYRTLYNGYYELHYDSVSLDTMNLMGNEYLYPGSDVGLTAIVQETTGYYADVLGENKEYNHIEINCRTGEREGYLEAPLFYYPGYAAYDKDKSFEVTRGENNRIRVSLPAGYEGTVTIAFREPAGWRTAETISILTVLWLIGAGIMKSAGRGKVMGGSVAEGYDKE
ncbi:MAG: hypothetical protein K2O16_04780 [Lachnospiraceae bacterium]|nr:hypothetical protein [Lachnospiraceae bacterium]